MYAHNDNDIDGWVIKTDEDGDIDWDEKYGAVGSRESGQSILIASDNHYVVAGQKKATGQEQYDAWLFKIYGDQQPVGIYDPAVDLAGIRTEFGLLGNYPNPCFPNLSKGDPVTTIYYRLAAAGNVDLTIYNLLGQKVRTLTNQRRPADYHRVSWNGKNETGETVGAGLYIYRLQTDSFVWSRRLILIK